MPGPRCVFDTDVLVAGVRSADGASRQWLLAALDGRCRMAVSVPLLLEYESVLTRPEHLAASGISASEAVALVDAIAAVCEPVAIHFHWRPRLADPADEMVLEAALNAGADLLLTFNQRHLAAAALPLGIPVRTPGAAWRAWLGKREDKREDE